MSRVEGFEEIGSRRARAREELGRLIEGESSVPVTGEKYSDQAVAVSYTRAGDRTAHTKEFYPEGVYTKENTKRMLDIHRALGGTCLYEKFCGAFEEEPEVPERTPADIDWGSALGQIGWGIHADSTHIYLVHVGGRGLSVVRKEDWTIDASAPTLAGNGRSIGGDKDYIYVGYNAAPFFSIYRKSDWSLVTGVPSIPSTPTAILVEPGSLVVANTGRPSIVMMTKHDWSLFQGLPTLDGTAYGLYSDATYLYLAHSNGRYFSVWRKSDWRAMTGTPILQDTGIGVYADNQYVYVSTIRPPYLHIFSKSNWGSRFHGQLEGAAYLIREHDDHIYLVHNNDPYLTVLRKYDWAQVQKDVGLRNHGRDICIDGDLTYIAHAVGPMSVVETSSLK